MLTIIKSVGRVIGVLLGFGLIGPPLGFAVFLCVSFAGSGGHFGSVNWFDFAYSVVELGLPAAFAGLVFCVAFYWLGPRSERMASAPGRSAVAAASMLLIFGIPIMESLFVRQHFNANSGLIALIACLTGALIGACLPSQLPLQRKPRTA